MLRHLQHGWAPCQAATAKQTMIVCLSAAVLLNDILHLPRVIVLRCLQVLRELYNTAFVRGSSVPLPEVINSLLAVPQPRANGPKVSSWKCCRLQAPARQVWQGQE